MKTFTCDVWDRRRAMAALVSLAAAAATSPLGAQGRGGAPIRVALIEGLSGPFGNTGEAVFRNLVWACERVNARGGVDLGGGVRRPLQIVRYDSKSQPQEALSALQSALDDGISLVAQGNSSAVAAALIEAINRHNEREPQRQVVFLNYAAVDPVLTNERCSFWHFRFDAHADMRMAALMSVLKGDAEVKSVYLIGQDYSFGQAVLREAKRQLAVQRPDVRIVGEELHPMARIKDFIPYVTKIKASGAQAVITGNWGNDLTLLVRAARELQYEGKFYTFYGNALGAPAAIGEAGVGKVLAVADWFPNAPGEASRQLVEAFRRRFPNPADDYIHLRMQLMIEALAQALQQAARNGGTGGPDGVPPALAVARALERADVTLAGQRLRMRADDHQAQQPLMVAVMERQGAPGVPFDVEGSGYGFRVIQRLEATAAEQPHTCRMARP
ncbi:MAG: branched-chain amino acid ABC transporter substrate-binding protein [Tepidimonas ignava]|uniref:Amino acid/amide ABC transporter substrate-binding protein (HAAT family) n=2 Tax=Tepidimonas ignava TaxID=114249 RepID=A0A4R3LMP5_9BURK|nr:branched-chain amino acid ABC transporter substrate-binding protein [Tepidimonas ignava]MCX7693932.1 branched-chain amino acid ABC transporter substrate-binding protein [Tepidimonas taiwanensis]TCS99854.1 amino acid/amide ABC transporter substrate-binding protein (HAAT family) [Tepidimonas ignava]TSE23239.1 Leucine-, isoleucine-, valine-, threonine-, and alanine-binding protein [Tepidimonas ignava]